MAEVCDGIEFNSKSSNTIDSIIDSISRNRNNGEKLRVFIDDMNILDYVLTLLQYFIPWAALFVLSLIALYCYLLL
jgi:hypothetical protein